MTLFLKKVWEKIKKYWQIFVGLFVGLVFAIRMWWQLRAQKKVLQKEIESAKKVRQAEDEFSDKVESIAKAADEKHEDRIKEIEAKEEKETEETKKDFDDRVRSNRDGSNEDLANKISDSLGVNVVLPEDDDA